MLTAAVLLMAGCSSSEPSAQDSTSRPGGDSLSSTSGDVRPLASAVAKIEPDLSEKLTTLQDDCVTPDSDADALTCVYTLASAQLYGELTRKGLEEASLEAGSVDDVATLLIDTLSAADGLSGVKVPAACQPENADVTADTWFETCGGAAVQVKAKGKALMREFAGWEPYS